MDKQVTLNKVEQSIQTLNDLNTHLNNAGKHGEDIAKLVEKLNANLIQIRQQIRKV